MQCQTCCTSLVSAQSLSSPTAQAPKPLFSFAVRGEWSLRSLHHAINSYLL
jgi:hypothetical protein